MIGSETFSRLLDWQDRRTCVLFGDGAGAVVLRAERGTGTPFDRGVLATHLGSDGRHYEDLYVDGGPSSTGTTGHLRMNGREVFRHAIHELTAASRQVLEPARAGRGGRRLAGAAPGQHPDPRRRRAAAGNRRRSGCW